MCRVIPPVMPSAAGGVSLTGRRGHARLERSGACAECAAPGRGVDVGFFVLKGLSLVIALFIVIVLGK